MTICCKAFQWIITYILLSIFSFRSFTLKNTTHNATAKFVSLMSWISSGYKSYQEILLTVKSILASFVFCHPNPLIPLRDCKSSGMFIYGYVVDD